MEGSALIACTNIDVRAFRTSISDLAAEERGRSGPPPGCDHQSSPLHHDENIVSHLYTQKRI